MSAGQRILVTGAAGYIGATVVRELLANGYRVLAVDRMYFGEKSLADLMSNPAFALLRTDVCRLEAQHLRSVHAVVDLAAISNDAAAELDPLWTDTINHRARVRLASLARDAGVERHVLVSSTSVYGRVSAGEVDETATLQPLNTAGQAAVEAERGCLALDQPGFSPTVLRLGTVFGLAPRMRFDLVVNTMTLSAYRHRSISIDGSGQQCRPHVHVQDVARAVLAALKAPVEAVQGEIFNIGQANLRVCDIADIVRDVLGSSVNVHRNTAQADPFDVRVRFGKAVLQLGWQPRGSIYTAVYDIATALACGKLLDTPETYTLNWYRHLRACEQALRSGKDIASPRTVH